MITVKDIVKKYLLDNSFDGLYCDHGQCGCDGSAPCGDGPYEHCCAAMKGPGGLDADGQMVDELYYADPRTIEDVEKDRLGHAREFSSKEMEFVRMINSSWVCDTCSSDPVCCDDYRKGDMYSCEGDK